MGRDAFSTAWYEEIEPHIGEDFQEFKRVLATFPKRRPPSPSVSSGAG